jgi:hypothetical protein
MNKTILASVIRRYKSIAFLIAEPFNFTFCHYPLPPSNKILANNSKKKKRKANYFFTLRL